MRHSGFTIHTELNGAEGFVAIDSLVNGTSSGGLRIAADMDELETKTLAREMTLKFSFIGLPRGGAKSGLKVPAGTTVEKKRLILHEFGSCLAPIIRNGIYYPGMDMNCDANDLRALYLGAGINLPDKATDTSYFTAISVANALEAAISQMPDHNRPLTVAIEGFGSVAAHLAARLPADRFSIVALSTVKGAAINENGFAAAVLTEGRRRYGDDVVNHLPDGRAIEMEAVLAAKVDILVPSARTWSIHPDNVHQIQARLIVPAANAPYTTEAIAILQERGIVSLPGFVTNAGGVFASSLHDSGVDTWQIEQIAAEYYRPVVAALLRKSRELGQSTVGVAEQVALQRLTASQAGAGADGTLDRLLKRFYRKGLLPAPVYARRFASAFAENLKQLEHQLSGGGQC